MGKGVALVPTGWPLSSVREAVDTAKVGECD